MRLLTVLFLVVSLFALFGCDRKSDDRMHGYAGDIASTPAPSGQVAERAPRPLNEERQQGQQAEGSSSGFSNYNPQNVSLQKADEVQSQSQATDRKIIRNGELVIETDDPQDGQRKITSIAESLGGFVVTSEFKQIDQRGATRPGQSVIITVRVPALQFNAALESIRPVGRVMQEKTSGQDVTEEYIDLEARIKTKKALEAQFLEIMKRAAKVSDALEVQTQIADVRAEIESLEGRRRFLENRAALSTINITLQTAAPVVTATSSGFWHDVKDAFGDGVDTAVAIVTGLIRFFIVMAPVVAFILLPLFYIGRFLFRRWRENSKPQPVGEAQ
jgi:hypothetical protein